MGSRDLSESWTGFTQFIQLEEKPPDGYMWSGWRLTGEFFADFNNLERVEQFKTQYQKHYENDTDELKRYGFFKKSKVNVMKLNALNAESVFGITSMSNS